MPPTREELNALEQWARGRDRRLARRAALVLAAVEGQSDMAVAVRFRVSKQTVSKWRGRFQDRRLEGLLDEPRPGAPRRITDGDVERVLRLTRAAPPVGLGRWTTRSMAHASGLSQTAISRIWRSHGLDPRQLPAARSAAEPDAPVDEGPPRADERPRASPAGADSTLHDVAEALGELRRAAETTAGDSARLRLTVAGLEWAGRALTARRGRSTAAAGDVFGRLRMLVAEATSEAAHEPGTGAERASSREKAPEAAGQDAGSRSHEPPGGDGEEG